MMVNYVTLGRSLRVSAYCVSDVRHDDDRRRDRGSNK